ncbi:MAG: hypothetical protein KDD82_05530 [Planctomycetes bacterium]|nr:hypothetical protein [Planctomycetota bacterium]
MSSKLELKAYLGRALGAVGRWLPVVGGSVWLVGCDGRPYRLDGEAFAAAPTRNPDWGLPLTLDPRGCSPALRHELRAEWLNAAAAEHASIASFARLSQQLLAVGASPALIAGAHMAALDEVKHAQLCYSLASAYAEEPLGPSAFPQACVPEQRVAWTREDLLERLALESLTDGCLTEGFAAALACEAGRRAQHPALIKVHAIVGADERTHAELAWSVLTWCLDQSGDVLRARVAAEAERLPRAVAPQGPRALAEQQRDHGQLSQDERQALYAATRTEVLRRAAPLFAVPRARAG